MFVSCVGYVFARGEPKIDNNEIRSYLPVLLSTLAQMNRMRVVTAAPAAAVTRGEEKKGSREKRTAPGFQMQMLGK